jgi:hypothetical protein
MFRYSIFALFLVFFSFGASAQINDDDQANPQETCASPTGCGGGEQDNFYDGWFWQEYEIDCDVSWSLGISFFVTAEYSESTLGFKQKCKDGNTVCLSDFFCTAY